MVRDEIHEKKPGTASESRFSGNELIQRNALNVMTLWKNGHRDGFGTMQRIPYPTKPQTKTLYTRSEIDGLIRKWGVKDTYWRWDPDNNEVFVQFKIAEKIDDVPRQFSAKVEAPAIWDRKTRSKAESINWDISMRVMFWFIKSHLEAAYLLQSSKTVAFLALHRHW